MRVCMFVKNSFEYDARVTKEAKSLIGAGHEVTVVAIHVPGVTEQRETTADGIQVRRVSRANLGVDRLNRLAGRYAGTVEARHERLTGEPVDSGRLRAAGSLTGASTSEPGRNTAAQEGSTGTPTGSWDRSSFAIAWGRITTPMLRSVTAIARFGFRVVKAVLGRQGRAAKTWAINRRMIAIGLEEPYDVYHAHDLNTLYVGAMCKQRTGAKLVYDSHELATERNRMTPSWKRWAEWNERRWLPHADAVIVASPSWEPWIREKYRGVTQPFAVVLNAPEYRVVDEPRPLRAELGIDPDVPILLYQGSIQENRGIEPAIEATLLLDHAVCVVVGYGHHRPVLEQMVADRGIGDRVKFFGPIPNDELIEWTAAADIGLANIVNSSVSYHTSLPNKLFEYLMAGVAVIGCTGPAIRAIVEETGAGLAVEADDPGAIAEAARTILSDLGDYRVRALEGAKSRHWGVEEAKLLALYETLGA
jgi:glycosyltransferase involved in cell wall biosynthesis